MKKMFLSAVAAAAVMSVTATASADGVNLPSQVAWTAYASGSSGYAQSVGLGNMLQKKYDVSLRIIPGNNDVSRMIPLRAGQAEICGCGIAVYFSQEGVYMFADGAWGPQRVRNLFNNIGRNGTGLAVAGDAGVKEIADLRGKRVTWVRGAPALNVNATAALAFGGLTWDDVRTVEVPGFSQSMQALIDGQADAAFGSTITAIYSQIAASPRGLFHPTFPHDDEEGWERIHEVAPYWSKAMVSNAVNGENNTSGEMPYEGATYPYPIFTAYDTLSEETAYGLTKAVLENYEVFKDAGPGMDGYQLENQNLSWAFPYHPGAIRYYEEKGLWTEEAQAHTEHLLERQDVLADAWERSMDEGFEQDSWLEIRADALEAAGMDVPFREN